MMTNCEVPWLIIKFIYWLILFSCQAPMNMWKNWIYICLEFLIRYRFLFDPCWFLFQLLSSIGPIVCQFLKPSFNLQFETVSTILRHMTHLVKYQPGNISIKYSDSNLLLNMTRLYWSNRVSVSLFQNFKREPPIKLLSLLFFMTK